MNTKTNKCSGGVLDDPIIYPQTYHYRDGTTSIVSTVDDGRDLRPFMRIVLDEMVNDPDPVAPGSQGTVVDGDEYQVIVDWDKEVGRSLHLIPGVDRYHVLDPSDTGEMEQSWMNLASIQSKLTGDLDSRCPRCGKLFDCKRGAISRRVTCCNISICPECGQQEAIEDFVMNAHSLGIEDVNVTVPRNGNHTGYEAEAEGDKEKLKIVILPISKWYIVKVWTSGT